MNDIEAFSHYSPLAVLEDCDRLFYWLKGQCKNLTVTDFHNWCNHKEFREAYGILGEGEG